MKRVDKNLIVFNLEKVFLFNSLILIFKEINLANLQVLVDMLAY